ncbi:MAG: hypothetical protein COW67_00270, partial [Flavobacteriales bacterium CG18_big_fil_WC_8_21_14_2_50_32_9]
MKTTLLLLLVILFSNLSIAQTTAIPDPNFEQALINLGLDSGPIDGVVLTANIDTVTELDVSWQNINNLTGIQDFSSLVVLDCRFNQLTSLDITQNISLVFLVCDNNLLNSLDVTYNTSLVELDCHYNQLTSLDVSQNISLVFLSCYGNLLNFLDVTYNISLKYFICSSNQLVELDLSQNTSLIGLTCSNNQLSCLNMKNGNNINITSLNITYNSNLTCVEVDNASYSTNNWNMNINYSYWMYFSENCNNLSSTVGIEENSLSSLSLYP